MREVVKTTILSHRWKTRWTTTSCLNFKDFMTETDANSVGRFVNRALILWRGTRIQKFKINFGEHLKKSSYTDIDFWLLVATKYGVEDLVVCLEEPIEMIPEGVGAIKGAQEEAYWAPQCLYSCSSLRRLNLEGCNLRISHGNVNWIQLEHLSIVGYFVNADLIIKQVLCGSPQLEVLNLTLSENDESIQSTSLEQLFICNYMYFSDDAPSVDTELRIETPELESLEMVGVPYSKCLINDVPVPFLTDANINFDNDYSHHIFSGNDFVGKTLKQIFSSIRYVNRLVLSDWCIKALGAMRSKHMLSPFPNLEVLHLKGCFEKYKLIVRLLELFPKTETLYLEHEKGHKQIYGAESLHFEAKFPNSFLQELREVVVTWDEVDDYSIFPFTETLLLYANKLKKMVFRPKESAPPSDTLVLAKKLMRMPRSSPTAELILDYEI